MSSIVANVEVAAWLSQVSGPAEIRDPQGNVLGHFSPAREAAAAKIPLPRKADPNKTYSLKEVYEHLMAVSDESRKSILRQKLAGLE